MMNVVTADADEPNPVNIAWKDDAPTPLAEELVKRQIIHPGDDVVDVGCGFGRNSNYLAEQGARVTGININDKELAHAQKRAAQMGVEVNYQHGDVIDIPLPDSCCDVALDLGCTHMLSKSGQKQAVAQFARIIRPGGRLVYFGFSENHPGFRRAPESPMYRSREEVEEMYGDSFDIEAVRETEWEAKSDEPGSETKHVGLEILMKRKTS